MGKFFFHFPLLKYLVAKTISSFFLYSHSAVSLWSRVSKNERDRFDYKIRIHHFCRAKKFVYGAAHRKKLLPWTGLSPFFKRNSQTSSILIVKSLFQTTPNSSVQLNPVAVKQLLIQLKTSLSTKKILNSLINIDFASMQLFNPLGYKY